MSKRSRAFACGESLPAQAEAGGSTATGARLPHAMRQGTGDCMTRRTITTGSTTSGSDQSDANAAREKSGR